MALLKFHFMNWCYALFAGKQFAVWARFFPWPGCCLGSFSLYFTKITSWLSSQVSFFPPSLINFIFLFICYFYLVKLHLFLHQMYELLFSMQIFVPKPWIWKCSVFALVVIYIKVLWNRSWLTLTLFGWSVKWFED